MTLLNRSGSSSTSPTLEPCAPGSESRATVQPCLMTRTQPKGLLLGLLWEPARWPVRSFLVGTPPGMKQKQHQGTMRWHGFL